MFNEEYSEESELLTFAVAVCKKTQTGEKGNASGSGPLLGKGLQYLLSLRAGETLPS